MADNEVFPCSNRYYALMQLICRKAMLIMPNRRALMVIFGLQYANDHLHPRISWLQVKPLLAMMHGISEVTYQSQDQ